jgi:hypothetical protein
MTAQEIEFRIEGLKEQLVAKYHPEKVILFGSAARDSDIINVPSGTGASPRLGGTSPD